MSQVKPQFTASPPHGVRRYGSGRYHKVEVYYDRTLYLDGQPIAYWDGWAWAWKPDWTFLRLGIAVGPLWKIEDTSGRNGHYQGEEVPPGMRKPTESEHDDYIARSLEAAAQHRAWNDEHPHQAWMRAEEATGRDPIDFWFPKKEDTHVATV